MESNIGKMLKEAREKSNHTQEQLAERVAEKRSYISRIERKENDNIKINTLAKIVEKGFGKVLKIEF